MTLAQAKTLKAGDILTHSGVWVYRIGRPKNFTVIKNDDKEIRVSDTQGHISLYNWGGCAEFVTVDFFASCKPA